MKAIAIRFVSDKFGHLAQFGLVYIPEGDDEAARNSRIIELNLEIGANQNA